MARSRRRTQPAPVAAALTRVLKHHGLDATLVQVELSRRWKDVVGEAMARNSWPEVIKDGQLVIATDHPAWKHEIHYRQEEILGRVNAIFGKSVAKAISTLVRPRTAGAEPPPHVRPQAQEFGAQAAEGIDDDRLRDAIRGAAAANAEARLRGRLG